ncbi:hypothetical protein [Psychrobacter sp. PAMC 21119]|uniref:hypothetical protein n=1 Tax=Psychrobacter sp. PAMC 21119 TaxID=1112209 RepID=UPI0002896BB8|nr:hypothetical protein [Psychrobacter sp. PAMC 21119]
MTDIKVLPGNLKEIEKKPRFVQFYKSHNVEALQEILVDLEVNYRSDDNKAALVWRVMNAKGMDFDDAANDRIDEQDDSTVEDELNTGENLETAEANTDENVQTVQDDTSDEHDAPSEQPNVEVGTDADKTGSDSIEKSDEVVDVADHDAPSNISDSNDDRADEADKPAETAGQLPADDSAPIDETPPEKVLEQNNTPRESFQEMVERMRASAPHISVKNTGDFDIYEPASCTLIKAGRITDIYIKPNTDKDKIVRNIEQLNSTRGKKLHITN